jgi:hypothetical protein
MQGMDENFNFTRSILTFSRSHVLTFSRSHVPASQVNHYHSNNPGDDQ